MVNKALLNTVCLLFLGISLHGMEKEKTVIRNEKPSLGAAIMQAVNMLSKEGKPAQVALASDGIDEPSYIPIQQDVALQFLSLDEQGRSTRKNTSGNHAVRALGPKGEIHSKANGQPLLNPGMEAALYSLSTLLFPEQQLLTPTCILMFDGLSLKDNPLSHAAAQASLTVQGESFTDFLNKVQAGERTYSMLDEASVSAHIIFSMLTTPCDYKPGNLMVEY